jgi:hypothetical protein
MGVVLTSSLATGLAGVPNDEVGNLPVKPHIRMRPLPRTRAIGRKEYGGLPVEVSVFIRWINQEESLVRGLPCAAARQ